MNISYRWLQACSNAPLGTVQEISDRLAARGFPVEGLRDLGGGLEGVVVARVLDVRPHPNADRLQVCDVDGGAGVVKVVCGAPNVEPGGTYPFVPVGSSLPGGMKIGRVKLRGEASEGMLCSERELGLGPGEGGLMELGSGLEPGSRLVDALDLSDVRLDVEVTANRPDLLSHFGVAREVAPSGDANLVLPKIPGGSRATEEMLREVELVTDGGKLADPQVTIRVEAPDRCPRYLGLVVRGVEVGPSPDWLAGRLRAIGARPINNVVDATNYVLHELGQPLHAFDLDRVGDRAVIVRRARDGEKLTTLDGVTRELTPEILAICDAEKPIAVAGVMGGADSEVDKGTSDVLLECALFTPGPIRATRKGLGLSTDASYRFERGVDPEGMRRAILRTAEIILATAGGTVTGPIVEVAASSYTRPSVPLRLSRIERLLGIPFEAAPVKALLEPLGFGVSASDAGFSVEVPGFRSYDVTREVDLIEEVARTHGYDAFPDTLRPFRTGTVPDHPLFRVEDAVRDELVASGLLEAQTPAFAPKDEGEVQISNPVSVEEGFLRSRLLPGLQERLRYNLSRGNRDVRLFEVGTVFFRASGGALPREETHVAGILHGSRTPSHWHDPRTSIDVWDLKGLLDRVATVASDLGHSVEAGVDVEATTGVEAFDPEIRFVVRDLEGGVAGVAGRIRSEELDLPPWSSGVWGFELRLEATAQGPKPVTYLPLPVHPGVDRDLALLVPRKVPVGEVLALIGKRGGEHLRETRVFDLYRGEELPEGLRSVGVRLRFRASDRTLKDSEVDEAEHTILGALEEELSVGFRGQHD